MKALGITVSDELRHARAGPGVASGTGAARKAAWFAPDSLTPVRWRGRGFRVDSFPGVLVAREPEVAEIERALESARHGRGAALCVTGAAGLGKSALLRHVTARAEGFRVLSATGTEVESDFAYAGLHQLCAGVLDAAPDLPAPLLQALEIALARRCGAAPGPLVVGLALLTLLSSLAKDQPVLCVIDDAHWLDADSMQALGFTARRVAQDGVALLFGLRAEPGRRELAALTTVALAPLTEDAAVRLLDKVIKAPLDERIRRRIVAEARGVPLALLEFANEARPVEMAGGYAVLGDHSPVEELYERRLRLLPAPTRLLLLVAAAEPLGSPDLFWRAVGHLGIEPTALDAASDAGLLDVNSKVTFRHPLARTTVYATSSSSERRLVHGALVRAIDAAASPDWSAWHRAQAATGPDEAVARALLQSAQRAQDRGGAVAAATFRLRAADLSPALADRVERALQAAATALDAGMASKAREVMVRFESETMNERQQAQADLLRGRIAFATEVGSAALPSLRQAAARLSRHDLPMAREAQLDALLAASAAIPSARAELEDVASLAMRAPYMPGDGSVGHLLVEGISLVVSGHEAVGIRRLQAAAAQEDDEVWYRRPTLAGLIALEVWDVLASERLLNRVVARTRASGALVVLALALGTLAGAAIRGGRLRTAEVLLEESDALAELTGTSKLGYMRLQLMALRGQATETTALLNANPFQPSTVTGVAAPSYAALPAAILHNGLGAHAQALNCARRALADLPFALGGLIARELIEAAVAQGEHDEARATFDSLKRRTQAAGTPWALGIELSCEALVSAPTHAERLFKSAIETLGRSESLADLERCRLLHGEWLARQMRRAEACEVLRLAHARLSAMGVNAFAGRAASSLHALGLEAPAVAEAAADSLTAQELQIARLAARGDPSKIIARTLFLSPRTVDAHLRSVFRKLGIHSRKSLGYVNLSDRAPN